jgi:putative MATE family efflux protein
MTAMWNKTFLKDLFKLSLPIMLQSLFAVLGSTITTLMTGQLGDIPLAAAGLANQMFFILSLVQFGIGSGASIFTAQYWGKNDKESIYRVLGVCLMLGILISLLFMSVALFIPRIFLDIFTSDAEVIRLGTQILRIVGFSFLFTPITNTYYMVLRSTGNVRLPMLVSSSSVILNTVLGYALVFGKLGAPAMGVFGAAYANLIARVLECVLILWMVYYLKTPLAIKPRQMIFFDKAFLKKILNRVLPVTLNELLWSVGISAYSAIYAHINTESIAAINIKASLEDLMFVPFLGITHACAIMIGNAIGSGNEEKSYDYIRQGVRIIFIMALILGSALILGRDFITSLYKITDVTAEYTRNLLTVLGAFLWLRTVNTFYFIAMLRSGGDTRFAYWMDVGSMWLIGVPSALLGAFVFKLPVYYVYLLAMIDEGVKFALSIWRYRSHRWIHNLVHD